ncbi:MAG: PhnD/SsuA/transferrin family substrate-binding protein [Pseudomonadota bacterium]
MRLDPADLGTPLADAGSSSLRHALVCTLLVASLTACPDKARPGTPERPLRLMLFPASSGPQLQEARQTLARFLSERTGLQVVTREPVDSFDAVQQLGSGQVDAALLNDLSFLLAEDTYRVQARLRMLRQGGSEHRAQIIVHRDAGFASPTALHGKRVAYVDPYSMTGFVLVAHLLRQHGVEPGSTSFVGSHLEAVRQVLSGDADAAATYVDESLGPGLPGDLRAGLLPRFPDAADRLISLATTVAVPNEPVAFTRGLDEDLVQRLCAALKAAASDPAALQALQALGNVGGFVDARGEDYAQLRLMLGSLGKNVDDGVPGGWKLKLRTADSVR